MLPDNPDDQAQLFYLLLLGLAVVSGLFWRYRGQFGNAVQHGLIWVLIFAGIIIAYGYREQLTGQLVPAAAVQTNETTVVLSRGRDGHFHADLAVNGTAIRFLVDTGATALVLSRDDAVQAGIDPDRLNYLNPAMTANGRVMSAAVRLDTLRLGPFLDTDVPAMVTEGALDQSLLGMSYLDRFGQMRIEGDRLYLTR